MMLRETLSTGSDGSFLGRVLIFHVYRYPLAHVWTYRHTASTTKCPLCLGIKDVHEGAIFLSLPWFLESGGNDSHTC